MSFNFGPTLLSWLEAKAPDVYAAILGADRESQKYFSGHGSAIGQAYNHVIMPLGQQPRPRHPDSLGRRATSKKRFKRAPEGMWLPETAVDLETLELLAEFGHAFYDSGAASGGARAPDRRGEMARAQGRSIDRHTRLPAPSAVGKIDRAVFL